MLTQSQVVKALADLASAGRYQVDPQGARNMNALFVEVARVINELETAEDEAGKELKDSSEAAEKAIDRIFDGEENK